MVDRERVPPVDVFFDRAVVREAELEAALVDLAVEERDFDFLVADGRELDEAPLRALVLFRDDDDLDDEVFLAAFGDDEDLALVRDAAPVFEPDADRALDPADLDELDLDEADLDEPDFEADDLDEPDFDADDLDEPDFAAEDLDFEPADDPAFLELIPDDPFFLLEDFLVTAIVFPPFITRSIEYALAIKIPIGNSQFRNVEDR